MAERIRVFVNGSPVEILRGMQVKHALIAFDQKIYEAALAGRMVVRDERGFRLGLEGALAHGVHILVRPRETGGRPPVGDEQRRDAGLSD